MLENHIVPVYLELSVTRRYKFSLALESISFGVWQVLFQVIHESIVTRREFFHRTPRIGVNGVSFAVVHVVLWSGGYLIPHPVCHLRPHPLFFSSARRITSIDVPWGSHEKYFFSDFFLNRYRLASINLEIENDFFNVFFYFIFLVLQL